MSLGTKSVGGKRIGLVTLAIALILVIALIYQLIVGGIRVEIVNGRFTVDPSGLTYWWHSATTGSRAQSTSGGRAETPATQSGGAPDADHTSAVAVVEEKGYSLREAHAWGDGDTLHLLIGDRMHGAIGGHAERAFFFVNSDWIGYDSPSDSAALALIDHSATVASLAYDLYAPTDSVGHPSLGQAKVRFSWDGQHLTALDTIPPASWSAAQSRRGTPNVAAPGVRPIIFLPGIMGSALTDAAGNEVWPQVQALASCNTTIGGPDANCQHAVLAPLAFQADGSPPPGSTVDVGNGSEHPLDVSASEPLAGVLATTSFDYYAFGIFSAGKTSHLYDITAENAAQSGYVVVQSDTAAGIAACNGNPRCFVPVGIDWRRSAAENAARVSTIVDRVLAVTGSDRVDILAHSQGGLIAEAMVGLPRTVGEINRIVTLGTPFLGAPKLLDILLYGGCVDTDCRFASVVAQQLGENFPGLFELMPSADYYAATGRSGLVRDSGVPGVHVPLTNQEAETQIAGQVASPPLSRNMDLVKQALAFHATADRWNPIDPSVGLLRMVGFDATGAQTTCDTVPCAAQQAVATPAATIGGVDIVLNASSGFRDVTLESGDGTVPLYSANLYNPIQRFDDRGSGHDLYWCGVSHMGLAQSSTVWQASVSYLVGSTDYTSDGIGAGCPDGSDGTVSGLLAPTASGAESCVMGVPGHNAVLIVSGNGASNECRRLLGAGDTFAYWALSSTQATGSIICDLRNRGFEYVVTDTGGADYGRQACAQLGQPGGF